MGQYILFKKYKDSSKDAWVEAQKKRLKEADEFRGKGFAGHGDFKERPIDAEKIAREIEHGDEVGCIVQGKTYYPSDEEEPKKLAKKKL
ncbi:unnamed protein product [marine sediment metagenome]|uniref:Uncharacterized protein n=1 Tax=marine sediment metagenome TaxID=412755 RepID=X1PN55_9ZZZZ